jgi:hypothetical protein
LTGYKGVRGMIVKDIYLGHTHVIIHDDCVVKSAEEVQAILKRCAEIVKADERRKRLESAES